MTGDSLLSWRREGGVMQETESEKETQEKMWLGVFKSVLPSPQPQITVYIHKNTHQKD